MKAINFPRAKWRILTIITLLATIASYMVAFAKHDHHAHQKHQIVPVQSPSPLDK